MAECARYDTILGKEMSECVDVSRGVTQAYTSSSFSFKVFVIAMIEAVETTKQGVRVGEDTVLGLIFAGDFVGIPETPEELKKQVDEALECTEKWRMTANVKICIVIVCNKDMENPVNFKRKWGEE